MFRSLSLVMLAVLALACTVYAAPAIDYNTSAARALQYFQQQGERIETGVLPTLFYASRRFGLSLRLEKPIAAAMREAGPNFRPFLRFLDEKKTVSEVHIRALRGSRGLVATALYCDLYPVPWDFFSTIHAAADRGGFFATQAAIALVLLKERKCSYEQIKYDTELKYLVAQILSELAKPGENTDLRIEQAVVAVISGNEKLLKPEVVRDIIAAQQRDGSWVKSQRATANALWLLYELKSLQRAAVR
ncbi:MAG: hypothetical protein J0L53_10410 [Spirochaetes bacterium]|nr:hypothetical protein [Spirochaetota bacterium]